MVGGRRQGWVLLTAMGVVLIPLLLVVYAAEPSTSFGAVGAVDGLSK